MAGFTLIILQRVNHKATAVVIQITTFALLLLGLTGLVGYTLQLELLYTWFKAARMALPTAVGMILVGVGLWGCWRGADWYRSRQYFKEDEKIAFVGAAVLIMVAVTVGIAGFANQQVTLENVQKQSLTVELKHRTTIFDAEVGQVVAKAKSTAQRPSIIRLTRALMAD